MEYCWCANGSNKWTPKTEEGKQEEDAITMWVHLKKVPLHMYSWEGLSFMTSAVGFPVRLHPEAITCTNFEVAKVFVNVDVSKVLPKEINFLRMGWSLWLNFIILGSHQDVIYVTSGGM